ncbi:serine/arginine repetitive matrix protein 2-like isoform X2 [Haliotis rufescens]|uniref:serine/arginine repetitive matrix protein 2-like isoform X2 n=1 Tax=Haliotis rufescens TaxID=6454 RepID=UPI00201FA9D0|nr:serine/arginine repetitive matrix protein 2-like isoform X2 [Haliotis rufescens]
MDTPDDNMGGAREDGSDKRLKLKRIKKKKSKFDLNLSTNNKMSFSARMNITAANSSVVKASLRANNKALAQSLEKVRQDLRVSYEVNNEMKKEFQDLQLRLMNLERVAGLKDDSLEKEVQRRMEDKTQQLKYILSKVSVHLLDAGSCLQDALDKCMDPSRLSVASSARNSSLGTSDDAFSPINSGATSSIYYNPNTFSRVSVTRPQPVETVDPTPMEADALQLQGVDTVRQVQEMTMILEQSVLAEANLKDECQDLPAVSEDPMITETESEDKGPSSISDKLSPKFIIEEAQRNGRSKSRQKAVSNSNQDFIKSAEASSMKTSELKRDRRGTFVVPAPQPQLEAAPTEDSSKQDRRGTFVVNKPLLENEEKPKKDPKRETFVLSRSPAAPAQSIKSVKTDQEVFKVPLPVCDPDDVTVYLNSDMELTEVINIEQISVARPADILPPEDENPKSEVKDKTKTGSGKPTQTIEKSKSKIAKSTSLTSISAKEKKDVKLSKSDSDISKESDDSSKPAVVLQLRKPGKIVFTASRKDYDGSRKAIPSKLPSRPRTKSKKEMKDMKDSIAANYPSPKNIFDFHDKTPVHLAEKSRVQPSVYDISINDSTVQPSVDKPEGKDNQINGETTKKGDPKCDSVSVTYNMPLKGSPDEKKVGARSRSRSRGPTSRSKSRSRKPTSDPEGEPDNEGSRGRRGRSRSRARKEDAGHEEMDVDEGDEKCNDRGRSRSRGLMTRSRSQSRKRQPANEDVEMSDANGETMPDQREEGCLGEKVQTSGKGKGQSVSEDAKEGPDESEAQVSKTEAGEVLEKAHEKPKNSKIANNKTESTQPVCVIDSSKATFVSSRNGRSKKRKPEDQTEESAKCKEDENDKQELGDKSSKCLAAESKDADPESIQPVGRASRAAKTKAKHINKLQADGCSDDEAESVTDRKKKAVESDDDWQDDETEMDESLTMIGDLQPVSSRDFIAKLSSSRPVVKTSEEEEEDTVEIQPIRKSSRSIGRRQRLPSESDDEVIPPTQTKSDDAKTSVASATDEELEDDDVGNKTKVVPATDDEGNSEEDAVMKKTDKLQKKKETSALKQPDVGQKSDIEKESLKNDIGDDAKSRNGKPTQEDAAASVSAHQLPLKGKPEPSKGRSMELKKVERQQTKSKKYDVKELLQAFTEFDDPDHSLRLNATCRNDSVVIAESIKNYSASADKSAKVIVPLDEMEDPGEEEEVYHLPLKGSPKESGKGKGQSRSKGRSRSKKRTESEDFDVKQNSREGKKDKKDGSKNVESGTYSLPLKGSPDKTKRKESRSRSKSRSREERGGKRKNYIEVDSDDEVQPGDSSSISSTKVDKGKNVEIETSSLKGSPEEPKKKDTKSQSRSKVERDCSQRKNYIEADSDDEDEIELRKPSSIDSTADKAKQLKLKETSKHSKNVHEPGNKAESETYSLPFKGSPDIPKRKDSRSRSKSRSRVEKDRSQRKKYTEVDSDDVNEVELEESSGRSGKIEQPSNKSSSETYSLPLKGSPDVPKKKDSRSRSKSRSRVGRSKVQRKKHTEVDSDDEDEIQLKESNSISDSKVDKPKKNVEENGTYSLPLKGSLDESKKKDSRSRSKSRSRVEKDRSQRKKYTEVDSDDEDEIQLEESSGRSGKIEQPSNKSSSETYSLPLKGSPDVLKKKDSRSRSKSRSRVEKDHSQRKKYTKVDSDEDEIQLKESSSTPNSKVDKQKKNVEESGTYSLPLKGSPDESKKKDSRSRSRSRSRVERGKGQRKKYIEADSDDEDEVQLEESSGRSGKIEQPSNKSSSETYSLPLKGSPDVPKKKDSRSRSKSRSRVERSKVQRKKHTEVDSDDEDEIQLKESNSISDSKVDKQTKNVEESGTYSLPLKGSPDVPKKKDSRSRSKSRSRVEKDSSQSRKRGVDKAATPERNNGNDSKSHSRRESLQITIDAEPPEDGGTRSVKKLQKRKSDEEISQNPTEEKTNTDKKTNPSSGSKNAKSTGKKSAKKKLEVVADKPARSKESQQAELKIMFNELKRKLSMLPNPAERMSLAGTEKENGELKRKRESEENGEGGMKRSCRTGAVSYKEPSMSAKLRRGDPGTSHYCTSSSLKLFKSPKAAKNERDGLGVSVLDNISNTVDSSN